MLSKALRSRLKSMLRAPLFWVITFWGNTCIFGGALIFHILEKPQNPKLQSMLDSLAWAVGMVTTVGGGDVHPVTQTGKTLAIFMMMGGAVFLWSYMALFIGILVEPELDEIQKEVSELQHDLREDERFLRRLEAVADRLEKASQPGRVHK
jgi:voltage-gated potassium channel